MSYKYRKAREIIDQVAEDLSTYDDQGLIDYSKLYKVLRKCNALLGEKINPEKQAIIDIKDYRGYLPEDFSHLNYAFLCKMRTIDVAPPAKGFHVEYKTTCLGKKSCSPCVVDCDNDFAIYQLLDDNWTQFTNLEVTRLTPKSSSHCQSRCPNLFSITGNEFEIGEDGLITTNFRTGHLYLNYVGQMEDSDEDLMVIDDPLVEDYYEWALKRQILQNIAYNKEGDVAQIYADAKIEASRAKVAALSYVNISGYTEIRNLMQAQRVRMYNKFFVPILGNC